MIDGVKDGVLFDGPSSSGTTAVFSFSHPMTHFGFYLDPNGPYGAPFAPQPEVFFTNRLFNDRGPDGAGALHPPTDGDVQALVYDGRVELIPLRPAKALRGFLRGIDTTVARDAADRA